MRSEVDRLKDILFKQKQLRILLLLKDKSKDWYISELAKSASTTYVHACNFVMACESSGIVSSEKHGKLKVVKLTEKGIQIADNLATASALIAKEQPQQAPQAQPAGKPTPPQAPQEQKPKA